MLSFHNEGRCVELPQIIPGFTQTTVTHLSNIYLVRLCVIKSQKNEKIILGIKKNTYYMYGT